MFGPIVFIVTFLFLVGCASEFKPRKSVSFQCDVDSKLWQPATQAAALWSAALDRPITVTADGDIPMFFVPELNKEQCKGANPGGCAVDILKPDARIEILEDSYPDLQSLIIVIMHEMGHHIRGVGGHLEGEKYKFCLMHDTIRDKTAEELRLVKITPADVEFVSEYGFSPGPNHLV